MSEYDRSLAAGYVSNHERSITTEAADFLLKQRNVGYADNDGRWVVSQLPELYWSSGVLRQRRPGRFLGAFDSEALAVAAINAAKPVEVNDLMLL